MVNLRKVFQVTVSGLVIVASVFSPTPASASTVREAQWFLDAVHAIDAQKITRGDGVKVCVIDTGVDATHPDLQGAVLPGKSFGNNTGPDGRIDPEGHGTSMSGLIAARGGGANNALGVAPAALILPVASDEGSTASFADQVKFCVDNGAKVINLSGGRPNSDVILQDEKDAFAYAVTHDVVVAISMGNRKQTNAANPFAALPGVIAVTGTIRSNDAWPDSWTGPAAALAAPATNVSTFPKALFSSGYSNDEGTSDSCAIVSGAAALIRAKYPNLNAANVVNRLIKSSTDLGAPGRDEIYGFGLLNAEKALTMDIAEVSSNPLGEPEQAAASTDTGPVDNNIFNAAARQSSSSGLAGGVILLVIIAGVIWVLIRRKRKANRAAIAPTMSQPTGYAPIANQPQATYGIAPPYTPVGSTPAPGANPQPQMPQMYQPAQPYPQPMPPATPPSNVPNPQSPPTENPQPPNQYPPS